MKKYRKLLGAKIHRATVTQADVDYEGSLTIPPELMQAADLREYEAISVWNVTTGSRFETYAITGLPRSTDICVNGAAAHLASPGDKIIIAAFQQIKERDIPKHTPRLIFVDAQNREVPLGKGEAPRREVPGPQRRVHPLK